MATPLPPPLSRTPRKPATAATAKPNINKKEFSPKLSLGGLNLNVFSHSGNTAAAPAAADTGNGSTTTAAKGLPGSDFMSNEDIHRYCEAGRKLARTRSVTSAFDAEALEAMLRQIPDTSGSMGGARMRARRVARWAKRIAKAEQMIGKWYAALFAAFEREYESEINKLGRGRTQPKPRAAFTFR